MSGDMLRRNILPRIEEALSESPVVLVQGARQTGKSTLAEVVAERSRSPRMRYLTLDDASIMSAAQESPRDFIAGLDGPAILDEVQHAPELFPAIKATVDRQREPGRFLLTGSANVLVLPKLSESLAGRMEIMTLWPFSQGELAAVADNLIDVLFADKELSDLFHPGPDIGEDLWERVVVGGFPEVQDRQSDRRRDAWFGSYVTTILQRDVREIANIEGLSTLPRILELLASRTAGLVNYSELSRSLGVPQTSLKRYLSLLKATFLVKTLPPWSANLGKRLVKTSKLFLMDTGLLSSLIGLSATRLSRERTLAGRVLENFVVMELTKQATWSETMPKLFHFRTQSGQEVDLLLESRAGRIVGVEAKASTAVSAADFRGLKALAEAVGSKFVRGIVLYQGTEVVPFGENLHALPISALWAGDGNSS